jgi:hypothetical protein
MSIENNINGDLPTEDFHLISIYPCRAYRVAAADVTRRGFAALGKPAEHSVVLIFLLERMHKGANSSLQKVPLLVQ